MAKMLSRRAIARYASEQLLASTDSAATSAWLVPRLAAYLIASNRTKELESILQDIQGNLAEQGFLTGTVTVAHELGAATDATLRAVETYALRATGAQNIHLDTIIDPAVLGGIKLELPGRELNATIAHQLQRLRTECQKA